MTQTNEITELLMDWSDGDKNALDKLLPLVENELRRIASRYMNKEDNAHTLQTTALVNEAYIKLLGQRDVRWQNRSHFFALASQIMRRILLDHARTQIRQKRGGGAEHIGLEEAHIIASVDLETLIELDDALNRLSEFDALKSRIVEMRYFGGLSVEETAEVLQLAPVTVMRHWSLAKAWLRRALRAAAE